MINPLYRILRTVGGMLAVLALACLWRMLDSHGVFTSVAPGFSGTCHAVASPSGPEDIVIDRAKKIAFLSAMDRIAFAKGKPSAGDGIYSYNYAVPGAKPVKLASTPKDFHPHGIALTRSADGKLALLAINHLAAGGNAIDIFAVEYDGGQVRLTETGRIASALLISPNAIAALDADHFYVGNDHTSTGVLGRWLDDNLVLPRANVLYFDGAKLKIAVKGLNFPNGAAFSPDGKYLYVPQGYGRALEIFERDLFSGQLKEVQRIAIASNLDNADVAPDGTVWIAGHPKAYAMAEFKKDPSKLAPSQVFRLAPGSDKPELVYADLGEQISGSSVGAVEGKTLLIGAPFGKKILSCTMP